ncbi:pyridoxal 5'-phosphate synthase glutaminase subunit PdxT [Nocardiopsis coralliicola]
MVAAAPRIGVLALQGDTEEHLRSLAASGAAGLRVTRPEQLGGLDGIVLPGGESTAMMKLADRYGLAGPLRARLRGGLPAFGTCAGMILLADRIEGGAADQRTLGGLDVTVRRNAFGRQVHSFEAAVAMRGVPGGPVEAVFIRAPEVASPGAGVEVLGRTGSSVRGGEGAAGRIVAVRQGSLLATSFHPELTGDARIHRLFVDIVKGTA